MKVQVKWNVIYRQVKRQKGGCFWGRMEEYT